MSFFFPKVDVATMSHVSCRSKLLVRQTSTGMRQTLFFPKPRSLMKSILSTEISQGKSTAKRTPLPYKSCF